jgi:hypothetical protein
VARPRAPGLILSSSLRRRLGAWFYVRETVPKPRAPSHGGLYVLKFRELTFCILIGRTQRTLTSCPPFFRLSRTFGVDLRPRYAHVNLDSKGRAARCLGDTLEHDMTRRHPVVELLQAVTYIACGGLKGARSRQMAESQSQRRAHGRDPMETIGQVSARATIN